jgi:SprT-like family
VSAAMVIPDEHLDHRERFVDFVQNEAEPWHREHLGRLYGLWQDWNARHYESVMVPPIIVLNEPGTPQLYGSCGPVSGWGAKSEIRIRPSLLRGTHPHLQAGERFEPGRRRFVDDVLLHEMIHQWQQEISGLRDEAYHGHGPAFRDVCNRIGAELGVPPVRTCKQRGADAHLPSCSQWPHNVRPPEHYQGAYGVPAKPAPIRQTFELPADPVLLGQSLPRLLDADELDAMLKAIAVARPALALSWAVTASGDTRKDDAATITTIQDPDEEHSHAAAD